MTQNIMFANKTVSYFKLTVNLCVKCASTVMRMRKQSHTVANRCLSCTQNASGSLPFPNAFYIINYHCCVYMSGDIKRQGTHLCERQSHSK